jgi:rubrerythrin
MILAKVSKTLDARLDRTVRRYIFSQPRSAGFALSSYADAEAGGEGQIFERALLRATDPALSKMIRRHMEDEQRHARLIDERRESLGLESSPIPAHLKLVDRLSAAAGDVLDAKMDQDSDIARVYALLHVIEERAVEVFERSVTVLTDLGDHESAALFASIGEDEQRHLKYCRAIGRKYAGSDAAYVAMVEDMRIVEASVYAEVSRSFLKHMLTNGMLELPPALRTVVGALMAFADTIGAEAPRLEGPVLLAA